jgi:hypothetical protein
LPFNSFCNTEKSVVPSAAGATTSPSMIADPALICQASSAIFLNRYREKGDRYPQGLGRHRSGTRFAKIYSPRRDFEQERIPVFVTNSRCCVL